MRTQGLIGRIICLIREFILKKGNMTSLEIEIKKWNIIMVIKGQISNNTIVLNIIIPIPKVRLGLIKIMNRQVFYNSHQKNNNTQIIYDYDQLYYL